MGFTFALHFPKQTTMATILATAHLAGVCPDVPPIGSAMPQFVPPVGKVCTPALRHLYPRFFRNGRLWTQLPYMPTVVLGLPTLPLWAGNPHG